MHDVVLTEATVEYNKTGEMMRHPLNGPYLSNGESHGLLTFAGHNLAQSCRFDDVNVFYLEFLGEPEDFLEREAWADPLRAEILLRLTGLDRRWYLSSLGNILDQEATLYNEEIYMYLRQLQLMSSAIELDSEKRPGYGKGIHKRLIVEVPNVQLREFVMETWEQSVPGWPIEGYNMAAGNLQQLLTWNRRPRDYDLFREVIDTVLIAFYMYPEENRHFVFMTNKLTLIEMEQLLDLPSLRDVLPSDS